LARLLPLSDKNLDSVQHPREAELEGVLSAVE